MTILPTIFSRALMVSAALCLASGSLFGSAGEARASEERDAFSPFGVWTDPKERVRVRIYECGSRVCGRIVWLKNPTRDGKPRTDRKNSDRELRRRPLLGLDILYKVRRRSDPREWKGELYNPQDGGRYDGYVTLLDDGERAEIQGCWLWFICREQVWSRVPDEALTEAERDETI